MRRASIRIAAIPTRVPTMIGDDDRSTVGVRNPLRGFLQRLIRAIKNRGTAENSRMGPVRPNHKPSPLATMALGAGAYLLLAAAVDFGVLRVPDGNLSLHTLLLTFLGLALVGAAEGFLAVIGAVS